MPPVGPPDRVVAAKSKKRAATAAAGKNLVKKSKTRSIFDDLDAAIREAAAANVDGDAPAAAGGGSGLGSQTNPVVLGDEVELDQGLLQGIRAIEAFNRGVVAPVGHENVQSGQVTVDVEVIAAAALKASAALSQNANDNVLGNRVNGAVKHQAGGDANDVVENTELIQLDKDLGPAKLWPVKVLKELTPKSNHATKVIYANAGKHKSPFDKSLNCRYTVDELWTTMKPFKAVQRSEIKLTVGDIVAIRPDRTHPKGRPLRPRDDDKQTILTLQNEWIAQIVEFRADGPRNVFALVAWLYWPKHLYSAWNAGEPKAKAGAKGYHGDYELVASNHLDIMDIFTIDDKINHLVERATDDADREGMLSECYYRQTYDYRTGKLSELKRYCKCRKFRKLDETLVRCQDDTCGIWLHQACIIHDVLSKKWDELKVDNLKYKGKRGDKKKIVPVDDRNSVYINNRRYKNFLRGEVVADMNCVQVTEDTGIATNVPIKCLKCNHLFT